MVSCSKRPYLAALCAVAFCSAIPHADAQDAAPQTQLVFVLASVQPPTPEFPRRAMDALDLLEKGKYGDAADAAGQLCRAAPGSSIARQIRGTIALWVGVPGQARNDFQTAAAEASDEAVTHLGLTMSALASTATSPDAATVPVEIKRTLACSGVTPAQTADIATVRAYFAFVKDNSSSPIGQAGEGTDPAAVELLAIASAHGSPKDGAAFVEQVPENTDRRAARPGRPRRPLYLYADAVDAGGVHQ